MRSCEFERKPRLDFNLALIFFEEDFVARAQFHGIEHAVFFEERDVRLVDERLDGVGRRAQVGQPALFGFRLPFVAVIVAVEDDSLVLFDNRREQLLQLGVEVRVLGQIFEVCRDFVERFGNRRIEDDVRACAGLRRTRRAELEFVAREGEWTRAVAVGRVAGKLGQNVRADFDVPAVLARLRLAALDLLYDVRELFAQIHRDNRRRSFVRAQAVVVARASNGRAQQVGMAVYRFDNRAQSREEYRVLVRVLAGVEKVRLADRNRPVVVLARTVDARKGLFVQQTREAVLVGNAFERVHNKHIVVDRQVDFLEHRGDFELGGRDFVMARLGGNAEPPQLAVEFAHKRQNARLDCAEIVVFKLLVALRRRAEERSARLHKVGTLHIETLVDKEVFLFRTERYDRAAAVFLAEALHKAFRLFAQNLHRAQQRRLFIQDFARIRAERRRNVERRDAVFALDERGRSRVPSGVAAGLEGGAKAARGEARGVRLALDEGLAREGLERATVTRGLHEGIVLLGRDAREGLEPVRVMRGTLLERPLLHSVGHLVGDVEVERLALLDNARELLVRGLGQPITHDGVAED